MLQFPGSFPEGGDVTYCYLCGGGHSVSLNSSVRIVDLEALPAYLSRVFVPYPIYCAVSSRNDRRSHHVARQTHGRRHIVSVHAKKSEVSFSCSRQPKFSHSCIRHPIRVRGGIFSRALEIYSRSQRGRGLAAIWDQVSRSRPIRALAYKGATSTHLE
ncbi:hypothetical protein J6590_045121 [Homalodisca vitripennis]|nr:hypothetical protein J6590_045121 [Homalodisca vitripennis]